MRMKRARPATAPEAPAQRMVEAAIEEIERHGLAALTVRRVAAAAGVNVAAVSYYFGSKEALVATALETAVANTVKDAVALLDAMEQEPRRALPELLAYFLEGALRYPGLGKAQLYADFVGEEAEGPFPRALAPLFVRLGEALRRATPGLDRRQATRRVVAGLSAVIFPPLFGGLFRSLGALEGPAERRRYVEELADAMLAPAGPGAARGGGTPG
jgi:TetR/AcrR family transcriptional regulator, regulator of cefoperazone and chloramphenicol sensitivity